MKMTLKGLMICTLALGLGACATSGGVKTASNLPLADYYTNGRAPASGEGGAVEALVKSIVMESGMDRAAVEREVLSLAKTRLGALEIRGSVNTYEDLVRLDAKAQKSLASAVALHPSARFSFKLSETSATRLSELVSPASRVTLEVPALKGVFGEEIATAAPVIQTAAKNLARISDSFPTLQGKARGTVATLITMEQRYPGSMGELCTLNDPEAVNNGLTFLENGSRKALSAPKKLSDAGLRKVFVKELGNTLGLAEKEAGGRLDALVGQCNWGGKRLAAGALRAVASTKNAK